MGQTRIAKDCEIEGAKCPSGNIYENQELTVSYLSPEADLFADSETTTNFVKNTPMWHWTRAYPPGGSLAFGVMEHAVDKTIEYLGSEPAPLYIEVTAHGAVPGIVASNRGIEVNVNVDLVEGDILVIDVQNRAVTKNGTLVAENQYDYIKLPDLQLQFGDNDVTVRCKDEDNIAFDSVVSYTGRYGGL